MKHFIGCDAHKKYSLFVAVDEAGETKPAVRVNHDRESYRAFLRGLPRDSSMSSLSSNSTAEGRNSRQGARASIEAASEAK